MNKKQNKSIQIRYSELIDDDELLKNTVLFLFYAFKHIVGYIFF